MENMQGDSSDRPQKPLPAHQQTVVLEPHPFGWIGLETDPGIRRGRKSRIPALTGSSAVRAEPAYRLDPLTTVAWQREQGYPRSRSARLTGGPRLPEP